MRFLNSLLICVLLTSCASFYVHQTSYLEGAYRGYLFEDSRLNISVRPQNTVTTRQRDVVVVPIEQKFDVEETLSSAPLGPSPFMIEVGFLQKEPLDLTIDFSNVYLTLDGNKITLQQIRALEPNHVDTSKFTIVPLNTPVSLSSVTSRSSLEWISFLLLFDTPIISPLVSFHMKPPTVYLGGEALQLIDWKFTNKERLQPR